MPNKYHAKKTVLDNIIFDSKAEAQRYAELKIFEQAGEISDLKIHPTFNLLPGVRWNGKRYRAATFTPDFWYVENDKQIVEDVKSKPTQTAAFTLRLKLWIREHPEDEWDFRIVEM